MLGVSRDRERAYIVADMVLQVLMRDRTRLIALSRSETLPPDAQEIIESQLRLIEQARGVVNGPQIIDSSIVNPDEDFYKGIIQTRRFVGLLQPEDQSYVDSILDSDKRDVIS